MVRIILHTIIMYMIPAWYIQVKISTVWSKNTYKSNYVADCSIFSIRGHCIIDQIRWLSSVNGEIGKHLNFVLVVDFIFNPSLGVMPLSLERPDLKELIRYLNTLTCKEKIFYAKFWETVICQWSMLETKGYIFHLILLA